MNTTPTVGRTLVSNRENRLFYTFRLFTICSFVVLGMMQRVAVFDAFVASRPLIVILMLCAAICICWNFLRLHLLFKNSGTWILVGFAAGTVLSSLLTVKYGIYKNVVAVVYLLIEFLIFYQADPDRDRAMLLKELKVIAVVVSVISFLFSLFTLSTYLMRIEYQYIDELGVIFSQGYHSGFRRAWGFYFETNFQGIMDLTVLFLSVIYAMKSKHIWAKVLWCINIAVHFCCYIVTSSRGTTVGFYAATVAFALVLSKKWVQPEWKFVKQLGVRAASAVLAVLLFVGASTGVKGLLPYIQRQVASSVSEEFHSAVMDTLTDVYKYNGKDITFEEKAPITEKSEIEEIVRLDIESKEDKSNGRMQVWIDGLRVFAQYPILGVSPENRQAVIKEAGLELDDKLLYGYTLLNGYLEILVGAGIVGFALMVWFLIKCFATLLHYDRYMKHNRLEISCILAIVVAMMVFALFISDLFFIKSIDTYLFWILLGYAMAIIKSGAKEETADRFAFMCDTPLQVLNATAFVSTDKMGSKGKSDLFLYHQFRGSEELSARLKEQGVFENVYDFKKFRTLPGAANKLLTLWRTLFPKSALKKIYMGKDKRFLKNRYSTLVVSFYTQFSDCLHNHFKGMRTVQIEDGLGSYVTADLENRYRTGLFSFVNKFLFSGSLSYDPQVLYLNNPQLGIKQVLPVEKLDSIATDEELLKTACRIFDYKENPLYSENRTVFLGQPLDDRPEIETIRLREAEINPVIAECEPVVRLHPRQTDGGFEDYKKDTAGNMWELECANSITDSHVLIGAFSTAQFTPKMMFGTEPTLIFLYKLLGCNFDNADQMTEQIRNAYTDKDKVIVVENMEQLKQVIDSVRKGE